MLFLYEELLLLAIDNEKSAVVPSVRQRLGYGMAGAMLVDLALQGRIHVSEKGRLELKDAAETGDKHLDKLLKRIQEIAKPRKLTFWIQMLNENPKKMRKEIYTQLVEKGYMPAEDDFAEEETTPEEETPPAAEIPPAKPSKYEIKRKLRAGVLGSDMLDARSLAVLSVARASELLSLVFTIDERDMAIRRIHETSVRSALDNATGQALEDIATAIAACLSDDMR